MRPTRVVAAEDSIERAVTIFRHSNSPVLPVVADEELVGMVNEQCLARALACEADLKAAVSTIMVAPATISPYSSGSDAFRTFSDQQIDLLIVADDLQRVRGIISPVDLFPKKKDLPRPPMVGGMATPFGVYLTTGSVRGGVSLFAVMATGALMFSMLVIAVVITDPLTVKVDHSHLPEYLKLAIGQLTPYLLFLVFMRLIPLSGTHGAEHMVVHALEREEDLIPEIVARMPRVHPRCGTNLAVGISMFLTIALIPWVNDISIRVFVGVILSLFSWRPLGSFVQQFITTKKPSPRQLRSGIKAGNELLDRFATAHSSTASVPMRLWNSGLIHVIAGSTLAYLAVEGITSLFHLTIPGLS